MWPILMQFLRSNAPYLTLPFAAVIGVIGYNLEGYLSDRYTPYNKRAFIMITSDGLDQGIIGAVINRFESKGLKLVALKLMESEELQIHYRPKLDISGPIIPMVWQGLNAVKIAQKMLGTFEPRPGNIKGDFCVKDNCNIVYGSDSVKSASREIALWFSEELVKWKPAMEEWIYE